MRAIWVAQIAALCVLVLSIPVIIQDYWHSPVLSFQSAPAIGTFFIFLYLLYGLTYAAFVTGFAAIGLERRSTLLTISASLLAASYVAADAIALLTFFISNVAIALDVPLILARGFLGIAAGGAILKTSDPSDTLALLVGGVCAMNGALVLLGLLPILGLSDFSAFVLAGLGYLLLARQG